MLRRLLRECAGLPGLMQFGLPVFAIGSLLDVLYHTAPLAWIETMDSYLGADGFLAHLVTLVGMVLTMLGVFTGKSSARAERKRSLQTERRRPIER